MDKELLGEILALGKKAGGLTIYKPNGEASDNFLVYNHQSGEYEDRTFVSPRKHKAFGLQTVIDFAFRDYDTDSTLVRDGGDLVSIWYNRNQVVAILDDTDYLRHHRVTMGLQLSPQIKELLRLEQQVRPMKQAEIISYLRTKFHGCINNPQLLMTLRGLRFTASKANTGDIQHGRRNVTSDIAAEVIGAQTIPETFQLLVPVFASGLAYTEPVTMIVDINLEAETISMIPAPNAIEEAIASAERRTGELIKSMIDEANADREEKLDINVYYGEP